MLREIHWVKGKDGNVRGRIWCEQEGKSKSLSDCKRCDLFSYATDLSIVCDWLPERNYVMKEADVSELATIKQDMAIPRTKLPTWKIFWEWRLYPAVLIDCRVIMQADLH